MTIALYKFTFTIPYRTTALLYDIANM